MKFFIASAMVVTATFASYSVYNLQDTKQLPDIVLANVEALAQNEDDGNWYFVGESNTCLTDAQGTILGTKYIVK